jgi:hypothetical protein
MVLREPVESALAFHLHQPGPMGDSANQANMRTT